MGEIMAGPLTKRPSLDQHKRLTAQLKAYWDYHDQDTEHFILTLENHILDDKRAFEAQYVYCAMWFRGLPMSPNAKVRIASALIKSVSQYNCSYIPGLWRNLSHRDSETMASVAFHFSPRGWLS
jgi:hypothetical protein